MRMEENNESLNANVFQNLTSLYSKEISYREGNPYFKYEKILSYYTLFLIIIGTVCNLISFIVMNRKQMQKYACMKYLSTLAISDMMILYQWNLNTFFKYNFSKPPFYQDFEEMSLVSCRLIAFFAFFFLQLSSWLLSLVSFDRLMLVYSSKWKHVMHKPNRIRLLIGCTVLIILLLNSHLLFLNGYVVKNDFNYAALESIETDSHWSGHLLFSNVSSYVSFPKEEVVCYKSKNDKNYIFPKWEKGHLLLYTVLPFTVMLVSNSLIIYNVLYAQKVASKTKGGMKRKKRMAFMLVLLTFTFFVLTWPSVIVHTFFRDYLKTKKYRRFVNLIVNNLLHTSHAINFFLYVFSAPNFRQELVNIFANISTTPDSKKNTKQGNSIFKRKMQSTIRLTNQR